MGLMNDNTLAASYQAVVADFLSSAAGSRQRFCAGQCRPKAKESSQLLIPQEQVPDGYRKPRQQLTAVQHVVPAQRNIRCIELVDDDSGG